MNIKIRKKISIFKVVIGCILIIIGSAIMFLSRGGILSHIIAYQIGKSSGQQQETVNQNNKTDSLQNIINNLQHQNDSLKIEINGCKNKQHIKH